jgi:hypothetical protein
MTKHPKMFATSIDLIQCISRVGLVVYVHGPYSYASPTSHSTSYYLKRAIKSEVYVLEPTYNSMLSITENFRIYLHI